MGKGRRVLRTIIKERVEGPVSPTLSPMAGGPVHSSDALMGWCWLEYSLSASFQVQEAGSMLLSGWTWLRSGGFQAVLVQCQVLPVLEISHSMFLSLHRTTSQRMESHWFQVWMKSSEHRTFRVKETSFVPGILHFLLLSRFPCLEPKYIVILFCFWCCVHRHSAALSEQRPALCWIQELALGLGLYIHFDTNKQGILYPLPFCRLKEEAKGSPPFASSMNVPS